MVLCSKLEGRLVNSKGLPVVGVTVSRSWKWGWNEKTGTQETTSDENGKFIFEKVTDFSLLAKILPHSPSISTQVHAKIGNEKKLIFSVDKSSYDDNSEITRLGEVGLFKIKCNVDLEASEKFLYWSVCELDR